MKSKCKKKCNTKYKKCKSKCKKSNNIQRFESMVASAKRDKRAHPNKDWQKCLLDAGERFRK